METKARNLLLAIPSEQGKTQTCQCRTDQPTSKARQGRVVREGRGVEQGMGDLVQGGTGIWGDGRVRRGQKGVGEQEQVMGGWVVEKGSGGGKGWRGGWAKVVWGRRVNLESRRMVSGRSSPYDSTWQMDCFDPQNHIYFLKMVPSDFSPPYLFLKNGFPTETI